MATFGEVSWSDDSYGDSDKSSNNKDIWLRLEEGSNEVRLVTQPFQYLVHRYKKEGDQGYGQKVYCSKIHGSCPLCDNMPDNKAKARWLLGVISRRTGKFQILDISYLVFSQIKKLAKNTQRWGDPQKYDVDIVVDKKGGASGYYSVQPVSKEPLSAQDQQIKDSVDLDELKSKVTPPTPDRVQKRLDKINGVESSAAPATKVASAPSQVSMTDDEDDMSSSFPAYDGSTT